jgi:SAM-dependent methyltransferase
MTNKQQITDRALFRLLGVSRAMALDHSDYEGAEIVADLNFPIKTDRRADFILDGSTLDNIFNPAQGIQNLARLLRPGGRLISANVYSNHNFPYTILTPLWLLDYFVINGFSDCRVYVEMDVPNGRNYFTINLDHLLNEGRSVSAFVSPYPMATLVFAEKGPLSTDDKFPSQQHYRLADEWRVYRKNLEVIAASSRPHLLASKVDIEFYEVPGGHLFMTRDCRASDPQTEINLLRK